MPKRSAFSTFFLQPSVGGVSLAAASLRSGLLLRRDKKLPADATNSAILVELVEHVEWQAKQLRPCGFAHAARARFLGVEVQG